MNERRLRQVHLDFRGKLILGGTAALDGEMGQFGLESIPVGYEG